MRVFLDPGHGGKDPGAVGNGLQEKNLTLAIAQEMWKTLYGPGVDVIYSRTTDALFELSERAAMANKIGADVFVSIHVNSAENTAARGVETYSYPGSAQGAKLAKAIQGSLVQSKIFSHNRGVKTANFAVVRETKMPAALVELGFISNAQDAVLLRTQQTGMAEAVAKGILEYLGIEYKEAVTMTQTQPSAGAKDAWEWARAKGLLDGTRPKGPVLREDLALVLKRFADKVGLKL